VEVKNFPETRNIGLNVEVWADEDGYPTKVEVTGDAVEHLSQRALRELAQHGVLTQMGRWSTLRAVYNEGRDVNRAEFTVEDQEAQIRERFPGYNDK
jgi:cytosine/adenosine deaminase-related metal-dependent hydrolase